MNIVIDRIEDGLALLDVDGEIIEFPLETLPEGSKEGDLLAFIRIDASEILAQATERLERMQAMSQNTSDVFDI